MFRLEIIHSFLFTLDIQSVHSFNTILNYAQSIGLNIIDEDGITPIYIASDQYQKPLSECEKAAFIAFFCRHYCVNGITKYISHRLEKKLQTCLHEFLEEIPGLGQGISAQIPPYTLEKKLTGLPAQKLFRFLKPISEDDDSYYQIKSFSELKKETAYYLAEIQVFKKRSKTFKFGKIDWNFTIIEGDNLGEYSYISYKLHSNSETLLDYSTFEEEKLYQYFTLKAFNDNKQFLMLRQSSFQHFCQLQANFSDSYLIDIDFKPLGQTFLALTGLEQAQLIRPQLTYEQFLSLYKLNQDKCLQSNCIVNITSAKQFFTIKEDILKPGLENLKDFIIRHRQILVAEKLYTEITNNLNEKKLVLEAQLAWRLKKNKNTIYTMKFVSPKALALYTSIIIIILFSGVVFPTLFYIGLGLLTLNALLIHISVAAFDQMKLKHREYGEQMVALKKERDKLLSLKNAFMQIEGKTAIVKDKKTISSYVRSSSTDYNKNNKQPTSISNYLLRNVIKLPNKIISLDSLVNYRSDSYAHTCT